MDSDTIYEGHIAALLHGTGHHIYQEVVEHLDLIRALLTRAKQEPRFASLAGKIRAEQKRKRNSIKLLDLKGW